jgi:GAF domain-containing protein
LERLLVELVECSHLDELARMTGPIAEHLTCNLAEISFLDADREYLQGIGALAWRPEGHRYPLADFPLTQRCLDTLEIMTVDLDNPEADAAERAWMTVEGVNTMIGLPVLAAGNVVGLLECSRSEPLPWSRLQLRHARIIATVLGPVISSLHAPQ